MPTNGQSLLAGEQKVTEYSPFLAREFRQDLQLLAKELTPSAAFQLPEPQLARLLVAAPQQAEADGQFRASFKPVEPLLVCCCFVFVFLCVCVRYLLDFGKAKG